MIQRKIYSHNLWKTSKSCDKRTSSNGQFYAQGRRVTVDQVDPNLNQTEKWNFVHHAPILVEVPIEFNFNECPVCKTNGYADQGQIKEITN